MKTAVIKNSIHEGMEFLRMGHGEDVPNAQCPKRRGDYLFPPTLTMEFPVAFNELPSNHP